MSLDPYFDLSPTDRSMAILDRRSPVTFHVIWDLIGDVRLDSLGRAWDALSRVHPILSCSADIELRGVWQPGAEWAPLSEADEVGDVNGATVRQLANPVSFAKGPLVRLTAIRRPDGYRFVLVAHHAAFDGAASVVLIDDLRTLYRDLAEGRPPRTEPDLSPRTVRSALRDTAPRLRSGQAIIQSLDRWRKAPPSTHVDPASGPSQPATGYATIDLSPALRTLDHDRRRNSWPIDAVLLGLLEAAWDMVFGSDAHGTGAWLLASNLRHRLGMTRGIGNLSGVEPIVLRRPRPEPVQWLIEQAAAEIAATRAGPPGLGPELMARSWAWMPPALLNQGVETMLGASRDRRYTRVLSNMGRIPDSLGDWGSARLEGLTYLGPMGRGPYCMFVPISHRGSSSLTVRTARDWLSAEHAENLGAAINRLCGVQQETATSLSAAVGG